MKKKAIPLIIIAIALIIPILLKEKPSLIGYINIAIIYSISVEGLNLLLGIAGQISLGHAAFMAIGGYTSALLVMRLGFPSLLGVISGAVVAGIFGLIIGFPSLRLKGFYLAIATMALGSTVTDIIKRVEITGADRGLTNIPPISLLSFKFQSEISKYYLFLTIFLITVFMINNLLKSKSGMAFKAMRDSELGATVFGVNIAYYKILAFVISSFLAGLSGALYAHSISYLHPMNFGLGLSVELLAITIIGGLATLWGPIMGSILWIVVPRLFGAKLEAMAGVLFGIILILVVLFLPRGLYELVLKLNNLFTKPERQKT